MGRNGWCELFSEVALKIKENLGQFKLRTNDSKETFLVEGGLEDFKSLSTFVARNFSVADQAKRL